MFNWIKNYFDKWVKKEEERQIRYLSGKGKKESKEGETTMTGKPMNKIETKVKDKED